MTRSAFARLTAAAALTAAAFTAQPAHAVFGGKRIGIAKAPYTVNLQGCTGSLIAPQMVLTAAHCVDGVRPQHRVAVVGDDPIANPSTTRKYPIAGYSVHPGYKLSFPFAKKTLQNAIAVHDVAVAYLAVAVTDVEPVGLPGVDAAALEKAGRDVDMFGYGQTRPPKGKRPRAPKPQTLHGGTTSLISRAACLEHYPKAVSAQMLCALDTSAEATQGCPGDSGGPVVTRTARGPVQIGVLSWGSEVRDNTCGSENLPTVWMKTSAYRDFILDTTPVIQPFAIDGDVPVTGTVAVGQTLTCGRPRFGGTAPAIRYRWLTTRFAGRLRSDNVKTAARAIPGATGETLTLTAGMFAGGQKVACEVSAENASGRDAAYSANLRP